MLRRLPDDNQQLLGQLLQLQKLTTVALSDLSLDKALDAFMDAALTFTPLDACNFWLVSEDGRDLLCKAGRGCLASARDGCPERLPSDAGLLGKAFRTKKTVAECRAAFEDSTMLGKAMRAHGLTSLLAAPVALDGRPIGVLSACKKSTAPFLDAEIAALTLVANQAAIAIKACGLNEQIERKNVEFEKNMRLTQGILTSMSSGVALLDRAGAVKMINRQGAQILRCDPEDVIGRRLADRIPETAAFMNEDTVAQREIEIEGPGGARLPVGFSTAHYIGAEGKNEGVIVVFQDLTEMKALQAELLNKERFAAMGRLVAGVAHEIRNPLFGISSVGQIFERELTSPAHLELVRALLSETKRLNALVEELLIYGRPVKLTVGRCDLVTLWHEVFEMHRDGLREKNITIAGDCSLPRLVAYLDANQIRQVFLNLLRNAMDAVASGGQIAMKVLLEDRYIICSMRDTGIGIPKENLGRVFDLFFTTKPKGTGLGLPICRKIVEDHGGEITVESEEKKGTVVTIKLPFRKAMEEASRDTVVR